MAVLHLELLGDFRLRDESGALIAISAKKSQAMLAFLGVKPSQLVSRDKMANLLWSSTAPEQARQSLRQTLSTLRRELAQVSPKKILVERATSSRSTLRWFTGVVELESLIAAGPRALDPATRMYDGDFLERLPHRRRTLRPVGDRGARPPASPGVRAHGARRTALARRCLRRSGGGRATRMRIDPLRSRAPDVDAVVHAQGDLSSPQQFDACAKVLRRELDVEPDAETKSLRRRSCKAQEAQHGAPERDAARRCWSSKQPPESRAHQRLLKAAGYHVLVAKDGPKRHALGREHVDLMLLDTTSPSRRTKVLEASTSKASTSPILSPPPRRRAGGQSLRDRRRRLHPQTVKNSVLLARVAKVLK